MGNELYIRLALHSLRCFPMPRITSFLPHDCPGSARQHHHTNFLDGDTEAQSSRTKPGLEPRSARWLPPTFCLLCFVTRVEGCGYKGGLF